MFYCDVWFTFPAVGFDIVEGRVLGVSEDVKDMLLYFLIDALNYLPLFFRKSIIKAIGHFQ